MEIENTDHIEYLVKYAISTNNEEICRDIDSTVSGWLYELEDADFAREIVNIIRNTYFNANYRQSNQKESEWWKEVHEVIEKIEDLEIRATHESIKDMLKDIYDLTQKHSNANILAADQPPFWLGYVIYWEEANGEENRRFLIDMRKIKNEKDPKLLRMFNTTGGRSSICDKEKLRDIFEGTYLINKS